jgi:hypothetical protein
MLLILNMTGIFTLDPNTGHIIPGHLIRTPSTNFSILPDITNTVSSLSTPDYLALNQTAEIIQSVQDAELRSIEEADTQSGVSEAERWFDAPDTEQPKIQEDNYLKPVEANGDECINSEEDNYSDVVETQRDNAEKTKPEEDNYSDAVEEPNPPEEGVGSQTLYLRSAVSLCSFSRPSSMLINPQAQEISPQQIASTLNELGVRTIFAILITVAFFLPS